MKHIKDLRTYLARLRELGDLRELDREVDDNLELAAIARHATETLAPAVLFNRIRGCPQGYRALGAPVALSSLPHAPYARVAISLGMEPGTSPLEIVEALAASIDRPPILPELVEEAACQQHLIEGEAVDLHRFPQPLLHVGDGGRYFGTLGTFVVRTPDRQWTNWTICRVMLVDRNHLVARFDSMHTRLIHNLWKERGEPMPFALVQGTEPAVMFAAGMSLPERVDHGGYIGAHFGEPIEVVRCRTVDLEVPAAAEIVVEGHVSLDETTPEGPMGEYPGYLRGGPEPWPMLHVSAITHRSDPILPFVGTGKPVDESHTICCLTYTAIYLTGLRKAGIPATHVWWVPESSYSMMVVTLPRDWEQRTGISSSLQLTRRIAEIVVGNDPMNVNPDAVIARIAVFDDDIDPSDPRDLIWALSTRCHPTEGRVVIEQRILPLVMCYSQEERTRGRGPLVAFDGLLLSRSPDGEARPLSTAFADNYPRDLQQRILAAEDN